VVELGMEDRAWVFDGSVLALFVKTIRETDPQFVYIPHSLDGDREHRLVNEVSREALWIAGSSYWPDLGSPASSVGTILGYEIWQPMTSYQLASDITAVIEKKKNALKRYASQLLIKDWASASLSLNNFRGVTSGKGAFVEVFQVIRVDSVCF
jgi:LmbE family N-acetylglucosaminyl deacetylase